MPLTPKQERFVTEYLVDLNATQAALRAGYSPRTAPQQGSRLLKNVHVQAAIAAKQTQQLAAVNVRVEDVLRDLQTLAAQSGVPARDGSWSTGILAPGLWDFVSFDEPGKFLYHCEDHPWAVGEIIVDP